jgi:predicted DNA-binding protein (MmcQ/YjbR family)
MHHSMMTRDQINAFCAAQPATTHVVQWGNSDVWKVGGKVFAVCGWNEGRDAVTFKVSKLAFEVLQDAPGIRPAPYLASRGMSWLQVYGDPGLNDKELCEHIVASYQLVVVGFTKAKRADLGV